MNFFKISIAIILSFLGSYLDAQSINSTAVLPYANPYTFNCSLSGSVSWYLNNLTANTIKLLQTEGKYVINGLQLTINDLRSDILNNGEIFCNNSAGIHRFQILPEPYMFAREKSSITVTESGYTSVICKMIVGFKQGQTINWEWKINNQTLTPATRTGVEIKNSGSNNETSELTLRQITTADKGEITCSVSNGYGKPYVQTLQLRVKNTLAALWPFLAIVGEVVILCVIILIFEKKCSKKDSTNEDEAENLMSKQKDNNNNSDLKKRAVKA